MEYLIDGVVVFSLEKKKLWLMASEDEHVELSNQAVRLLTILMSNQGQVLERDFLIDNAWGHHGFKTSNNSLGVAISELRKKLEMLGLNPQIIVTIPKIGFSFNADIQDYSDKKCNQSTNNLTVKSKERTKKLLVFFRFLFKKEMVLTLVFTVTASAIFALIFYVYTIKNNFNETNELLLFQDEGCSVYAMNNKNNRDIDKLVKLARIALTENKIMCNYGKENVYYTRVFEENEHSSYDFIGICKIDPSKKVTFCKTFIKR